MRTSAERLEQLTETLKDLREKNRQIPIVVEGIKDVASLERLGIVGKVLSLNAGLSILQFAELRLSEFHEVIILTDWDRTGGRLARLLSQALEANDRKFDLEFRKKLSRLCKKDIKDVEGLADYLDRLIAEAALEKS